MKLPEILSLIENGELDIYVNYKSNYRGKITKNNGNIKYDFDVDSYSDLKELEIKNISTETNVDGNSLLVVILSE